MNKYNRNQFTIESLAKDIQGRIVGATDFFSKEGFSGIFNILNDSNEGDIVIRHWINEDGIKIAYKKKLACLITENPRDNSIDIANELNFPIIIVDKIELANAFALKWTTNTFAHDTKKVVVSGTNGKSTTTHMINHILKSSGANTFTNTDSKSEYNTLIDPMISKLISEEVLSNNSSKLEYLIIEASEVQGWLGKLMKGHAYLLTEAINPNSVIITNIAMDHIGLVNSISEVYEETSGVIKALNKGVALLNFDDDLVKSMADFTKKGIEVFFFSTSNYEEFEDSQDNISQDNISQENIFQEDISQDNISQDNISQDNISQDNISQESIKNKFLNFDPIKKAIFFENEEILTIDELPFKSNHFIQNTVAAIAACISLNLPLNDIKNGVKSYIPLKRRFSRINEKPLIIDDFAHNPDGIKATVNAVYDLANDSDDNVLWIICAIRGSRGKEINKLNAESLANVISNINSSSLKKTSIKIILSSSDDVVDNANTVKDFEREIFVNILKKNNFSFTHYVNLHDALFETYNQANKEDLILLIGAQGMDPAESLFREII